MNHGQKHFLMHMHNNLPLSVTVAPSAVGVDLTVAVHSDESAAPHAGLASLSPEEARGIALTTLALARSSRRG